MNPKFNSEKFSQDAADLCRRLLEKDENKRLGSNGCEEIMTHPWFSGFNWELVICDRMKPPYRPPKDVNAASQSEIGTFKKDNKYHDTVIEDKDREIFENWNWTNPHAYCAEVIEFLICEREKGEPLVPINHNHPCCCCVS